MENLLYVLTENHKSYKNMSLDEIDDIMDKCKRIKSERVSCHCYEFNLRYDRIYMGANELLNENIIITAHINLDLTFNVMIKRGTVGEIIDETYILRKGNAHYIDKARLDKVISFANRSPVNGVLNDILKIYDDLYR